MERKRLQPISRFPQHHRKLSCEEIIDEMEKEQDAAVVRLLKEVDRLRTENLQLRKQLYSNSFGSNSASASQFSIESSPVVDSDYHYMLPSHRNSLTRKPSPVETPGFHPINTSMPTQNIQRKRGASVTSPRTSLFSVDASPIASAGETMEPLQKESRRWSVSDTTGNPTSEAVRRWQEFKIR